MEIYFYIQGKEQESLQTKLERQKASSDDLVESITRLYKQKKILLAKENIRINNECKSLNNNI